jgi:hypothetical protein
MLSGVELQNYSTRNKGEGEKKAGQARVATEVRIPRASDACNGKLHLHWCGDLLEEPGAAGE